MGPGPPQVLGWVWNLHAEKSMEMSQRDLVTIKHKQRVRAQGTKGGSEEAPPPNPTECKFWEPPETPVTAGFQRALGQQNDSWEPEEAGKVGEDVYRV